MVWEKELLTIENIEQAKLQRYIEIWYFTSPDTCKNFAETV